MKTLLISSVVLTALFLAGCSDKQALENTATQTPTAQQQAIPENEEHWHDAKWWNVAINDVENVDTNQWHDWWHATITSEEQFIAEMIPHHQEAVDTAKIILAKWENPTLKKIAQAIVDGQSSEITMLKWWLSSWYPSSTYKATYQNMMRPLNKAGHDLEDQFMEDMIKHHQWAIKMAKEALEISQKPEIVKFANDVINAQSSEITEFQKLLDSKDRH